MKKSIIFPLWTILLIIGCTTTQTEKIPAYVQKKCDAPILNIGDIWRWRTQSWDKSWIELRVSNYEADSYVIENIEPEFKRIVSEREPKSITTMIFKVDKKTLRTKWFKTPQGWGGRADNPFNPFCVQFPIYVGKKWNEWYGEVLCDIKVVAYEDITVLAGTFKAFKMESYRGIDLIETVWYSPEIKVIVKVVSALRANMVMELISHKIKDE